MPFPRFKGLANKVKQVATTPIKFPGRKVPRVKPMGTSSMSINAGKRFSGGMTSASRMPTQTFATRGQARAAQNKPKLSQVSNTRGYSSLGKSQPKQKRFGSNINKRDAGIMQQKQQKYNNRINSLSAPASTGIQGRRTRRRSSAGFSSFAKLINFAINN